MSSVSRLSFWMVSVVSVLCIAFSIFVWVRPADSAPTKLSIAVTRAPDSALVYIAQALGYFRGEGLEVTLQPEEFGRVALETMLQGKADLATVAETPIMLAVMHGKPLMVVAGIFSSNTNIGIVARKDRNITSPEDLAGKRVGVAAGTNGDYFCYAFLITQGVPMNAVEIISLKPSEMASALESGQVDAVSVWHPFLYLIDKTLGNNGISFYGGSVYTYTFNIAAAERLVATDPLAVKAFLRGLKKAEQFANQNRDQAIDIVASATQLDTDLLTELWSSFSFRLSLEQALLIGMENQAKWAIKKNLVERKTPPPNFLESIYFKGLQTISPASVSITH